MDDEMVEMPRLARPVTWLDIARINTARWDITAKALDDAPPSARQIRVICAV